MKYLLSTILFCGMITAGWSQSTDCSYVMSRTYTTEDGTAWLDQIDYDNGLGQQYQQVKAGITPNHQDLVTLYEYDDHSQPLRTWLPAMGSGGMLLDVTSLEGSARTLSNDSNPYTYYTYKNLYPNQSKEFLPGADWHQRGKCRQHSLYTEDTTTELKVLTFSVLDGSHAYYVGIQSLSKLVNEMVDEDGVKHLEFKDKDDNIVAKRTIKGSEVFTTYYVYDDRGNLLFVLPPELAGYYEQNISYMQVLSSADAMLQKYGYEYRYDRRDNCIYKKLPGCEPVYNIYDKADRLIFTQNGAQRIRGEWSYSIPDIFGRTVMTGVCHNSYTYTSEPLRNIVVKATRNNAASNGYSISGVSLTSPVLYTVNYYDDYSFIGYNGVPTPLAYDTPPSGGYGTQGLTSPKGLPTGNVAARMNATGVAGYDYMAMYYDDRGRVIQTRTTNHLGGYDYLYTGYDFTGNILKEYHTHQRVGGPVVSETNTCTYDHAGRLLTRKHRLNNGSEITLTSNTYDNFGRLIGKVTSSLNTSYTYNVRSWLKSISTGTKFSESLYYNESHNGNTPRYGGDISAMIWKSDSKNREYVFSYDVLSRLTQASYSENGVGNGHYNTEYTYDKMGNVQTLKRYGLRDNNQYGLIDNLTFTYNGNQVTKVEDAVSGPFYSGAFHFVNGSGATTEYTYDQNGNMTKDLNKNISSIQYNLLNLPSRITYSDGKSATYVYGASGKKLCVSYQGSNSSPSTKVDYCGNLIYENNILKQILIDGSYITFNGSTPQYHFYLKDHLGNNRVVVNASGTVEQVNHYYPFGGLMGESTNGDVQRYKYNGKELDRMNGLDWYDYGARHMDAVLGRWSSMEPLYKDYYDVSPYVYTLNNPVRNIDPDGKSVWTKVAKGIIKVGKSIAKEGMSALSKADTYLNAFSDVTDAVNTLTDANASTGEKVVAGASLASELLPVSVGDFKDAGKAVKHISNFVHGNSKSSTKAQHAYDIINTKTGKVVKTGVSGGRIRKDGKSSRAESQVRKWNKEEGEGTYRSEITHQEPAGEGARERILEYEKNRAVDLREELLTEKKHTRP